MKTNRILAGVLNLLLLLQGSTVLAQIDREITYQGYLTDASGTAIDGGRTLTFRLYPVAAGGTALWVEQHPGVAVTGGLFVVRLGSLNPINLAFDQQYWLGTQVGTRPSTTPLARNHEIAGNQESDGRSRNGGLSTR